jgi:hypothetical protein
MRKALVTTIAAVAFTLGVITTTGFIAGRQTEEARQANYPKLQIAIEKMQEAVDYLQNSPNDFGGHKAAAIRDTKQAIASVKQAIEYRADQNARN